MIQSMTGYGKSVVTFNEKKIHVEIKSLNSKALDLSTRIAPLYREKEMEIRQLVAKTLIRGKVDFSIWIEKDAAADAAPINAALLENYYVQIKNISAKAGIPEPQDWFGTLLRLPDIMTRTEVEELSDEEWAAARRGVDEALAALVSFRARHKRGEATAGQPPQIFPRDNGRRHRPRQETRLHRPGNGTRNQHHRQQEQQRRDAEHRGEDEG